MKEEEVVVKSREIQDYHCTVTIKSSGDISRKL